MATNAVGRRATGLGVLVVGLLLALGCSARTPVRAPLATPENLPAAAAPVRYELQAGDVVAVHFYGNEELNEEQPIRPDGMISLPFIGQVRAADKAPGELEKELEGLYQGELAAPRISVIVRDFSPLRIFVGGEVATPGAQELRGDLTMFQAVQLAGGFLPSAYRRQVILIRLTAQGVRVARAVNVMSVLSGRDPEADIVLQAQDLVFVPRTRISSVGEWMQQYVRDVLPTLPYGFAIGTRR